MKLVMIETPLRASGERTMEMNLEYARKCMKDSLSRGEAPFAMHLLYTQVLDDLKCNEREQGLFCGFAWSRKADLVVLYTDHGISSGMQLAYDQACILGQAIEYRTLPTLKLKNAEASATSPVSNVQPNPGVF